MAPSDTLRLPEVVADPAVFDLPGVTFDLTSTRLFYTEACRGLKLAARKAPVHLLLRPDAHSSSPYAVLGRVFGQYLRPGMGRDEWVLRLAPPGVPS